MDPMISEVLNSCSQMGHSHIPTNRRSRPVGVEKECIEFGVISPILRQFRSFFLMETFKMTRKGPFKDDFEAKRISCGSAVR